MLMQKKRGWTLTCPIHWILMNLLLFSVQLIYNNQGNSVGKSAATKYVIANRFINTMKTQLSRNHSSNVPAAAYTDLLSEILPRSTHNPQQMRKKSIPKTMICALPMTRNMKPKTQISEQITAIIRLIQLHLLASRLNMIDDRIAAAM